MGTKDDQTGIQAAVDKGSDLRCQVVDNHEGVGKDVTDDHGDRADRDKLDRDHDGDADGGHKHKTQ